MKTTKKTLHIDGMHCSSCAMNIDFDLEELAGGNIVQNQLREAGVRGRI